MFQTVSACAGRLARVTALGLFSLSLVPSAGVHAAERPLDIAAALLSPADIAPFGFEEYGVDTGRYFSMSQMLTEASGNLVDPADVENLGIESVGVLYLHPILINGEQTEGPLTNVQSSIYVFEDEDAAEAGFDFIEDESNMGDAEDLDSPPAIGDASEVTEFRHPASAGTEGMEGHRIDVSFRIGRLHASVMVSGWDEEVDRQQAEELAAYLEAKLIALLEDGRIDGVRTPGLSLVVPRYEGETFVPLRSHYSVLNGTSVASAEYPESSDRMQEIADEEGIVAHYSAMTQLPMSADGDHLYFSVMVTRYAQGDDAEAYVARSHEVVQEQSGPTELLPVEDLGLEVDSAVALAFSGERNGEAVTTVNIVIQQGRMVIDLSLDGYEAADLELVGQIVRDALACADEGCATTLSPSNDLITFLDEQQEVLADR